MVDASGKIVYQGKPNVCHRPGLLKRTYTYVALAITGAAVPLLIELAFYVAGWDINRGVVDSDKFLRLTFRILDQGMFGWNDSVTGKFLPELDVVPGYPYFVAAIFWLLGRDNFWAVGIVQALLAGGTVLAIGLAAQAIKEEWLVPAAILAAVWPNLAYRPTTILSETLFTFLLASGLCALLWAAKADRPFKLLLLGGVAFGAAYLTRPVLLFFPILLTPALAWLIHRERRRGWRSVAWAGVPIAIMLAFTLPNYVRSYAAYGQPMFTLQQGHNLLFYIYPCLAADWGCGNPDQGAAGRAQAEFDRAVTPEIVANPVVLNAVETEIGTRLISELGPLQFAEAVVGSTLKLLLHTTAYEVLQRFDLPVRYFGQTAGDGLVARARAFVAEILSTPSMLVWALAEAVLLLSRVVQAIGAVGMLWRTDLRPAAIVLLAYAIAVLGVSVGFGNPRYRVPLEPGLILLTVAGLDFLVAALRRPRTKETR